MEEDEEKQQEQKEETKLNFPTKDWFRKKELDTKTLIIDYTHEGEDQTVAFFVDSLNPNQVRKLRAEYEKISVADDGTPDVDLTQFQDALVLKVVSYGDPPERLSEQDLDFMKENKKDGIYEELLYQALTQSGMDTPLSSILKQKK